MKFALLIAIVLFTNCKTSTISMQHTQESVKELSHIEYVGYEYGEPHLRNGNFKITYYMKILLDGSVLSMSAYPTRMNYNAYTLTPETINKVIALKNNLEMHRETTSYPSGQGFAGAYTYVAFVAKDGSILDQVSCIAPQMSEAFNEAYWQVLEQTLRNSDNPISSFELRDNIENDIKLLHEKSKIITPSFPPPEPGPRRN